MKLNISGYVTPNSSYGLVLLNVLEQLTKLGVECSLFPAGSKEQNCGKFNELVSKCMSNSITFDDSAPSLRIAHQFDLAQRVGKGKTFAYTFFEMDTLTDFEKRHMESVDKVLVASRWAENICIKNNLGVPTAVVPLGYDPTIFNTVEYMNPNKCIFISVGKWEVRKGQEEIVQAFKSAFEDVDDVELWMAFDNSFMTQEFLDAKKNYYGRTLGSKVKFIPRMATQLELARAMHQAFCYVAPSRAEGFNLELLESMACGLRTIATNYSGHTEIINDKTSYLIQPTNMIPAVDNKWFNMNPNINIGNWIDYSIDDLVDCMKQAYDEHANNKQKLDLSAHVSNFTWEQTASKILKEISNG